MFSGDVPFVVDASAVKWKQGICNMRRALSRNSLTWSGLDQKRLEALYNYQFCDNLLSSDCCGWTHLVGFE
jgi:hypothetical protein